MKKEKYSKVSLVGVAMGIAETIPGVSGGTIAFIFKIYQELLETIKSINPSNVGKLLKGDIKGFFTSINGPFIVALLVGMVGGIVVGVFGISFLLETYPLILWAFFFGLVLASAAYLSREVKWDALRIMLFLVGSVLAFAITNISPVNGSDNPFFIIVCGVIAISALMLPGISGSFMLLLLGMYSTIIGSLKDFISGPGIDQNLMTILLFGIGCLIGLFSFSRVLSYTFKNYFNSTMAAMIGILIGSLNKLWPWRIPNEIMDKTTGVISTWSSSLQIDEENTKIISETSMLPSQYSSVGDPMVLGCVLAFLLGVGLILILSFKGKKDDLKN